MFHAPTIRFGFRQVFRTRKFLFAGLVSLLPFVAGIIMLIVDGINADRAGFVFDPGFGDTVAFFLLSGTIPFVALLLAGGLLADEAEDRTLTYLLVRPIPRMSLYVSKAIPVIVVMAALATIQVLLFALMRLLSYLLYGANARVSLPLEQGQSVPDTMNVAAAIAATIPGALLGCILAGCTLAAFFGLVSLLTTKYHFFANLLVFLVWELPFGHLGGKGIGFLTATFHGISILDRLDPTSHGDYIFDPIHPLFSALWLVVWIAIWLFVGGVVTSRRGFNVTSAAS